MKKRILAISLLVFAIQFASAQATKKQRSISVWNITEKTALVVPAEVDTAVYTFPDDSPMNKYSLANAYTGTLGSPLQSRIYFDRTQKNDFLFSTHYDAYFLAPTDITFYNVKTPYSYLEYQSHGKKITHDDDFKGIFSVNVNKKFNFSGLFNYVSATGVYNEQAAKQAKAGLWGYYSGKHYAANAIFMYQQFNNMENGGIADPLFILNPDSLSGYEPVNIPTNLSAAKSRYQNIYGYYNHKLHLANVKHMLDTVKFEYRPIASISHTVKYEQSEKRYIDQGASAFYDTTYYTSAYTHDSAVSLSFRNTLAFSINEGFSKYFPMSIIGYLEHDYREYANMTDSSRVWSRDKESNVLIGAEMSKRSGRHFLFNANGEINTVGPRAGDFKLEGGLSSKFAIFKDTVAIKASGFMKNSSPSYFEQKYISNCFVWDNNFDRTFRSRISGQLEWHNRFFDIVGGVGAENVKNLIYFNQSALPQQYADNIQVLNGNAEFNLHLWILHIMNKGVYQVSSNEDILPLPEFSTYHNAYITFKMFKKVLTTQIGADMYYNTAYYTPNYMPATGMFYLQNKEKFGDYPLMSAYLNFHLKTARFYFKYYHVNAESYGRNYFSMPNYPLSPMRFKMGVSMNLYE